MEIEKSVKILMRSDPKFNEKWLQDQIAQDPTLLGLGDLVLKDLERRQASGGRLDLLFEDAEGETRYTVELQLGATDETHIIRTIEYWDIERNRYPNYEHVAVIVAEEITSRFFNVISLFNRHIPIIAIQIAALKVADRVTLYATKVLDLAQRPEDDEDGGHLYVSADRDFWVNRAGLKAVESSDDLFFLIQEVDPSIELSYKFNYWGISKNGKIANYIVFKPRKNYISFHVRLPEKDEYRDFIHRAIDKQISRYNRYGFYVVDLDFQDIKNRPEGIKEIIKLARDNYTNIN